MNTRCSCENINLFQIPKSADYRVLLLMLSTRLTFLFLSCSSVINGVTTVSVSPFTRCTKYRSLTDRFMVEPVASETAAVLDQVSGPYPCSPVSGRRWLQVSMRPQSWSGFPSHFFAIPRASPFPVCQLASGCSLYRKECKNRSLLRVSQYLSQRQRLCCPMRSFHF